MLFSISAFGSAVSFSPSSAKFTDVAQEDNKHIKVPIAKQLDEEFELKRVIIFGLSLIRMSSVGLGFESNAIEVSTDIKLEPKVCKLVEMENVLGFT